MTSPVLTVLVLAVLWLIVVVPMIVRRHDERADERSVDRFGQAMRTLGRRDVAPPRAGRPVRPAPVRPATVAARRAPRSRADMFVPGTRPAAPPVRRPVPAVEEAPMSVDRSDLSPARAQMMARRRRALAILGVGSVLSVVLALSVGGVFWVPTLLLICGLGGYLYFLRSQVTRDRERRDARDRRASARPLERDAGGRLEPAAAAPASAVCIDDEDIELENLDTVDLTGLYDEETLVDPAAQRRAS